MDDLLVIHAEESEPEEVREVAQPIADVMTTAMYQPSGVLQEEEEEEEKTTSLNGAGGLKCMEDPEFAFDAQKASSAPKRPNYRVLEDPFEDMAAAAAAPDPMTTGIYDASTSSSAAAVTRPSPKLGARPPASDIMEGTKEKLDRFWGSKSPGGGGR